MTIVDKVALTVTLAVMAAGAVGGAWLIERHRADAAAIASLSQARDQAVAKERSAEAAATAENHIQTVTRTVFVRAQGGADHVETIDPKCGNGDALVADFRRQLDGLRGQDTGGDRDPAP